jgi:hypothetical protein
MNRVAGLVLAGLVLLLDVTLTWPQSWNPTASDPQGNTAGGTNALPTVTTGEWNTAFGESALYLNTAGSYNTAGGYTALYLNTEGSFNTATGYAALYANTEGNHNTATGYAALVHNTTGHDNTATGVNALRSNDTGDWNTASGYQALLSNTTGSWNTASGLQALADNTDGAGNTALGRQALQHSTGSQNIAVGHKAGEKLTRGSTNIYLGHPGVDHESKTMRLGSAQTRTFLAGVTTAAVTGTNVLIDANGQLGVPLSSARYKRDIEPLGAHSAGVLQLRPVSFVYTHDVQGERQYGLIAEEVAAVYPELVTHTPEGELQAVRYQELIPLLVNELQRQRHEFQQALERQQQELAALRALVEQQRGRAE